MTSHGHVSNILMTIFFLQSKCYVLLCHVKLKKNVLQSLTSFLSLDPSILLSSFFDLLLAETILSHKVWEIVSKGKLVKGTSHTTLQQKQISPQKSQNACKII